ncbi:MAG: AAA family ATPase [Deltaproteobacteria bacterium]|nr:AAA family ATPase [Deltaproteobacteria bacterium]
MRFRRLYVRVFGPLRDREFDLDADAVLVFGHNESGKSSFRSALETIVYGFEPASRDAHPLVYWDDGRGGDLHLEADLRLDSSEEQRVERVLQATGKSRTASASEAFEGKRKGNRPLPWTSGVPRELFQAVYSLELEQLAALERKVQVHVDDLLLPERPGFELRPVSDVLQELGADHQRLWRSDLRGKPEARALREQLAEAKTRAREAAEADHALRDARAELDELGERVGGLRERRRALECERDEAPYLEQLFEWGRRQRAAGPALELGPLGNLPLIPPEALSREIAELEETLQAPSTRLEAAELTPQPGDQALLGAAAEIEALSHAALRHEAETERLAELSDGAAARRERARVEFERTLAHTPRAEDLELAGTLPLDGLRALQASWAGAWEQRARAPSAPARPPLWSLVLGAAGFAFLLGGLLLEASAAAALGAALLFAALAAAVLLGLRAPPAPEPPERPKELDETLGPLALAPGLLASPAELLRLLDTLERVQRGCAAAREGDEEAARLAERLAARESELAELCTRLEQGAAESWNARLERLREAFERARESERRVEQDRRERREAERMLALTEPSLARKREHLRRLEQVLRDAAPGASDPAEAFIQAERRRREHEFLSQRETELRADPRFERLAGDARLRASQAPDDAPWLPRACAQREEALEECSAEIERMRERQGTLQTLIDRDAGSGQARAEDAVHTLEVQLRSVERERDRLALLEAILARAERIFRDERQPDVLRRASAHLRRVTDGRYTRLDYQASPTGGLLVSLAGRAEPVAVGPPISRGTLDQIHLCLRLGLLDHLDEERETLPLVLDDALLRMDDVRRPEVYGLLTHIAQRRQIFFLTCHRNIAGEAERALKARRVDLTP